MTEGYENGYNLKRSIKSKENASVYVSETLFQSESENEELKENISQGNLPTIFPIFEKGAWFRNGITFSDAEECAIIRSFQNFPRFFMADYCFKRFKPGSRIFLTGPVSKVPRERGRFI